MRRRLGVGAEALQPKVIDEALGGERGQRRLQLLRWRLHVAEHDREAVPRQHPQPQRLRNVLQPAHRQLVSKRRSGEGFDKLLGWHFKGRDALRGHAAAVLRAREAEGVLPDAQQARELLHRLDRVAVLLVQREGQEAVRARLRRPLLAVVHALPLAVFGLGGARLRVRRRASLHALPRHGRGDAASWSG